MKQTASKRKRPGVGTAALVPVSVAIHLMALLICVSVHAGDAEISADDTPEHVLDLYIRALQEGNLEGVRSVYHPPDASLFLSGPVNIVRYQVKGKKVLAASDLGQVRSGLPPREGDVQLDVLEVREKNGLRTYRMYSFWIRRIDGSWKIYAQAKWGG